MKGIKPQASRTKNHQESLLKSYLSSLLYLREDAKREGLKSIATIMENALQSIEHWVDTGKVNIAKHDLLDPSLMHALNFLLLWLNLSREKQQAAIKELARYEEQIAPIAKAVPKGRPNKRIADPQARFHIGA
ncbi:MAG: hypothetical protein WBY44_29770 [Bryobacteraceae bacterium]